MVHRARPRPRPAEIAGHSGPLRLPPLPCYPVAPDDQTYRAAAAAAAAAQPSSHAAAAAAASTSSAVAAAVLALQVPPPHRRRLHKAPELDRCSRPTKLDLQRSHPSVATGSSQPPSRQQQELQSADAHLPVQRRRIRACCMSTALQRAQHAVLVSRTSAFGSQPPMLASICTPIGSPSVCTSAASIGHGASPQFRNCQYISTGCPGGNACAPICCTVSSPLKIDRGTLPARARLLCSTDRRAR